MAEAISRPLAGLMILVVDDNEDARETTATLLGAFGAEVVTAVGAIDALDVLRTLTPDIIVTDLAMPGGTGVDLLERVRSNSATTAIPMIALTGYADDYRAMARDAAFDVVLTKPADPDRLTATIENLTGRQR